MSEKKTGVSISTIIAIFVIALALYTMFFISMHEQAHAVIYEDNGCSEVEIHMGFMDGHTTCSNTTEMTEEQRRCSRNLHNMNEIIGYQMYVVLVAVLFAMAIISMVIISR